MTEHAPTPPQEPPARRVPWGLLAGTLGPGIVWIAILLISKWIQG